MSNLDNWIDKINDTPGLSSKEKQTLRRKARELANKNNGNLSANDRAKLNSDIAASRGGGNSGSGGGSGTGDGGTGQRPDGPPTGPIGQPPGLPEPGNEWVWDGDKWIQQPGGSGGGGETGTTRACADVKGVAPEGFQWQGSYVVNADGSVSDTCSLVPVEEEPPPEDNKQQRDQSRTIMRNIMSELGFTTAFGNGYFTQSEIDLLFSKMDEWITGGWADNDPSGTNLLMLFRTDKATKDIYKKRFGGMEELAARGQAISERDYIALESSFRNVMTNYGLPTTYYDRPDDYARLIGAGLSVNEVEQRVVAAKQALNPLVAQELKQYYSISDGDLTAYMLGLTDEQGLSLTSARNQEEIRKRGRSAQIGGAAERAGFSMDRTQAELLAGTTVGNTIDPFQMGTLANLESTFDQARRTANRETTLAAIDNEGYSEQDTLKAVFGDDKAKLASERRAKRERSRFSGSSGVASSSLSVSRNL